MSGQTIRDVVIKIAIEMQQAKFAYSDIRGLENASLEAGAKAGAAFAEGFKRATANVGTTFPGSSPGSGASFVPGSFHPGGSGQPIAPNGGSAWAANPATQSYSLRPLFGRDKYRDMLNDDSETVKLKRNSGVLAENTKTRIESLAAIEAQSNAVLQLIRGIGLLGAALGEDTTKWLKYAAAAQGAMDIAGSAKGLFGALPPQGKLIAGGLAVAASPFLAERMNNRRLISEREDAEANGLPAGRQSISDFGLFQNRIAHMVGQRSGTAAAGGAIPDNEVYYRQRGIGEYAWSGMKGFSESVLGESDATRTTNQQLVSNYNMANRRVSEVRSTEKTLARLRGGFTGGTEHSDMVFGLGGMSAADRLSGFDRLSSEFRAGIAQEKDDPRLKKKGLAGGAREAMLDADLAKHDVESARERLSLLKQVGQELDHEKQQLLENQRLAYSQLDVERERLKMTKDRLGSGDVGDIGQLKGLAKTLNEGGELTEQQARLARKYGVAGDQADRFFQKEFERRFTEAEQGALAPDKGVRAAESAVGDANRNIRDAMPEIEAELAAVAESSQKIVDSMRDLLKAEREKNEAVLEKIQKLIEEQTRAKAELKDRGIKGKES